jgi:hypothetical protein
MQEEKQRELERIETTCLLSFCRHAAPTPTKPKKTKIGTD